jgi:hypothetical protein
MAQHYFVIAYDDVEETWSIDYETLTARFPEGSVWFSEDSEGPDEWVPFHELDATEKDNTRAVSSDLRVKINEWNADL